MCNRDHMQFAKSKIVIIWFFTEKVCYACSRVTTGRLLLLCLAVTVLNARRYRGEQAAPARRKPAEPVWERGWESRYPRHRRQNSL